MKLFISVFAIILSTNASIAQTDTTISKSSVPIEMLFPQGKTKALVLSYDDGKIEDRQLVKLLNEYGLKGTFHLNSNKLGTNGYLTKAEIKELFAGHEVSAHSANHPALTTLSKIDVVYEVVEDRKALELLMGYPVRGMAYPFGNHDESVIEAIKGLGIDYARTVDDTHNFKIPENFLKWHPTVHHFAKAFWKADDMENDKKELAQFYNLIHDFIDTKELAVMDIWGHSWEFSSKWSEAEKCFKLLANNSDILYTTQIDLVDYINAFHNLRVSVEKNMIYNPSSQTIFFKKKDKSFSVLPGTTLVLAN